MIWLMLRGLGGSPVEGGVIENSLSDIRLRVFIAFVANAMFGKSTFTNISLMVTPGIFGDPCTNYTWCWQTTRNQKKKPGTEQLEENVIKIGIL